MEGQMSIFDFLPKPKKEPGQGAIHRYLRYGPHTLVPEAREEVKEYLDEHGVPDWVTWDKGSLPCRNCTWYDGSTCRGGGHTCHYEYGYLICDQFCQSCTERKPNTVGRDCYTQAPPRPKVGAYTEAIGPRVFFDEILPDHYYIAECSTYSHKWYKVIYTKWIKDDAVAYVDSEKGIDKAWSWGNSFSCMTRKMYMDADPKPERGEASTSGWWYLLPGEESEG